MFKMKKPTLKELLEKHKGKMAMPQNTIKDRDSSLKNISFDPTKESSAENSFILLNSRKVRSIHQLCNEIGLAEEEVFNFHVTEHKNDFSHWIENIFNNKKLASIVKELRNRDEFLRILGGLISENEKAKIPKKFKEVQYKKTILVDYPTKRPINTDAQQKQATVHVDSDLSSKVDAIYTNNKQMMDQLNAITLFLSKSHDVNSKRLEILESDIRMLQDEIRDMKNAFSEKLDKLIHDEEKKFIEMLKELKDIEEYEHEVQRRMDHLVSIESDIKLKEAEIRTKEARIRKKKEKIAKMIAE